MADLRTVEKLLCERYNLAELDGDLADLVARGDVAALRADFATRELYRWREAVLDALDAVDAEDPDVEAPAPIRRRVLSDLRDEELRELAKANSIVVPEGAKKADVFKLVKAAKVAVPQPSEGEVAPAIDFAEMTREDLELYAEEHEITVPDGAEDEALRQLLAEAQKPA